MNIKRKEMLKRIEVVSDEGKNFYVEKEEWENKRQHYTPFTLIKCYIRQFCNEFIYLRVQSLLQSEVKFEPKTWKYEIIKVVE